jgi:hypothetical protein
VLLAFGDGPSGARNERMATRGSERAVRIVFGAMGVAPRSAHSA